MILDKTILICKESHFYKQHEILRLLTGRLKMTYTCVNSDSSVVFKTSLASLWESC